MKDYVKLILEIIKLGKNLNKTYKREKDVRKKKALLEAIKTENLVRTRKLHFTHRNIKRK